MRQAMGAQRRYRSMTSVLALGSRCSGSLDVACLSSYGALRTRIQSSELMRDLRASTQIDRPMVALYVILLIVGWMSIYASGYGGAETLPFYDLGTRSGKQMLWIIGCGLLILLQWLLNYRIYESFAYLMYGLSIVLLLVVLFLGKEVAGSRSWFQIWGMNIQPSELTKYATILALSKFMSPSQLQPNQLPVQLRMLFLAVLPAALIVLQGDTGTALTYSSLLLLMYRGGMSPRLMVVGSYLVIFFVLVLFVQKLFLITGIVALALLMMALFSKRVQVILFITITALLTVVYVLGMDFAMQNMLKEYQYKRIQAMIRPDADPFGYGWNVTQSKIAIGAGGFSGKGFLESTQTKYDFVPEKSTDFIFCIIAEEFGWVGSVFVLTLFVLFIVRIVQIAERQNNRFALLYGHGIAAIFLFHFMVNIAMTIGLFPVVGIPLPFISYGGSSLWAFTAMLFTLLKLDMQRKEMISRL